MGRGARPLAYEGLFQSVGQGLAETYLGAFALSLHAGSIVLGIVATLPTAATALAQAAAGRLRGGKRGARSFIVRIWSFQALAYAALGACVVLPAGWDALALCALAVVTWSLAGLAVPAWTALVAEIVPRAQRGAFFGLRGTAQQCGVLAAILGGGLLLYAMQRRDMTSLGFVLLFLLAGLARFAGGTLLRGVPEQARMRPAPPLAAGVLALRRSRKFRRLAFYLWGLHFGTHLATPFFVPYMLANLGFGYAQVGLLLAVPATVKTLTLGRWGRLADRIGPGPLLRSAGWLVVPVSALWLVSGSAWWIFAAQIYSGFVWGAFELAQASSLVQVTRGQESAVALFNIVDGAMMLAGSLAGAFLVLAFDSFGMNGYLGAIGCSSVMRALPAAVLLWKIRGIGRPGWSHRLLPFRLWAVRPTRGMSLRAWDELMPRDTERPPENGDE